MGLVIVFLTARFAGFDALPDPLGWGLVLAGTIPLRTLLPQGQATLASALVAGLISLPLAWPSWAASLVPSVQWALGLPQVGFCVLLCTGLSDVVDQAKAGRFRALSWVFIGVGAAPVLVYGGGVAQLAAPVAVAAVLANVYLVYLVFSVSRRLGPVEKVRPR